MDYKFINLTPHVISVKREDDGVMLIIVPSGEIARCLEETRHVGMINGVQIVGKKYSEVEGLPASDAYEDGIMYIVSAMVRMALPERLDVLSPGDQIRDAEGRIIGCKNFVSNW